MKPMLPSLTFDRPDHPDWLYEVKYDGFRAILDWDQNDIQLTSRNEKALLTQFPEIAKFLIDAEEQFRPFLPLRLDGELVLLTNPYKANFSALQVRGRLRSKKKIFEQAKHSPCRFMVFDVLMLSGTNLQPDPFLKRKQKLINMFQQIGLYLDPDPHNRQLLQLVKAHQLFSELWEKVVLYDGEGIVAKHKNSLW